MKLWLFGDGRQSGANRSERLRCETARILVACLGRSVLQTCKGPCSDLVDALETGRLRKSGQSITFRVALLCSCVSRRACMVVCICLECECLFSLDDYHLEDLHATKKNISLGDCLFLAKIHSKKMHHKKTLA